MLTAACVLMTTVPAWASFGIIPDSFVASVTTTQAGAHLDAEAKFAFNTTDGFFGPVPDGHVRRVVMELPAGLVGNPRAVPQCDQRKFAHATPDCEAATQVGVVELQSGLFFPTVYRVPVFNLRPSPNQAAAFGFNFAGHPVLLVARVRTGQDYGITIDVRGISEASPVYLSDLTFWGVPGDASHDDERWDRAAQALGTKHLDQPVRAFMSNPTECNGQQPRTILRVVSWEHPDDEHTAMFDSPPVTGCSAVPFDGTFDVTSGSRGAGEPSSYEFVLATPQFTDPQRLATGHVRDVRIVLPRGVRVNPSAADGLGSCTSLQAALDDAGDVTCPEPSKIGTVTIQTPLLEGPLEGNVYLGAPHDNPFDTLLSLILVARGQGVLVKLAGKVETDPVSGQLTATFADNPRLPFSTLAVHLKGGTRAPLVNPESCGTYETRTAMTSWSGAQAVMTSPLVIDQGCDRAAKFAPSLTAGVVNPVANASSPMVVRFSRPDGEGELGAINGSLPPGLLGVLASVPLCSATQGAAGTCPAASRVGKVQISAGAGGQPVWLPEPGRPEDSVYLTEPYREGDIAGLSVVVRAVAGPFDLGTVVTKVYLELRDKDQGIDFESDRLPRILQGIPLNIREVVMTIDRKGFMVNPTNCSAMATYANVFSQSWAKVPVTSRFQVGGCGDLALSPIVTARAGGRGNTSRYEHPALQVAIRQPASQAHLDKTYVVLPKAVNIDLKAPALKAACPRDLYAKDDCSPVAAIGTVKAVTPLLREPLTGPAFLIQKKGQLPDLVMRLRNNRMSLDLIGVLDFLKDGRLITRVKGIPDAALSSFVLNVKGGKDGSLLNRSSLCSRHRVVKATFAGQNGKRSYKTPLLHIAGCGKGKAKTKAKARRASRAAASRASARAAAASVRSGGDQRATGGRS